MQVIEVSDSGYDNGFRQGRAVAGRWEPPAVTRLDHWIETVRAAPRALCLTEPVEDVVARLQRWTRDLQLRLAADLHRQKMDALPDLCVFPELRGMDQYLDDEARGFAAGAGIDVREVYLERYWRDLYFGAVRNAFPAQTHDAIVPECSEFYFAGTPQGPLIGKGWDDSPVWYQTESFPRVPAPLEVILLHQARSRGYSYVHHRRTCEANEVGLCWEQGGGARYEREPERAAILFPAPVRDLMLRLCATVDEAVSLLTRYNVYWGPCNAIVGDAVGNAAVIEKARSQYAVRRSSGGYAFSTTGGCEDPALRRLCDTSTLTFQFYARRRQQMESILAKAGPGLSLDVFFRAVLHHDPKAPGCVHADTRPPGFDLVTMGCFAHVPRQRRFYARTVARDGDGFLWACAALVAEGDYEWPVRSDRA